MFSDRTHEALSICVLERFLKMSSKRIVPVQHLTSSDIFPVWDHTWNPVCSNKNKPTNISVGTWFCPLITGDSSCFVKVILGWGYDTLWARYSLNIRLWCVCWVVTWQYPEETFNLFNTKCYVTCTESLSVIIHSLHPATCPSILSWKGSVRHENLTQRGHL